MHSVLYVLTFENNIMEEEEVTLLCQGHYFLCWDTFGCSIIYTTPTYHALEKKTQAVFHMCLKQLHILPSLIAIKTGQCACVFHHNNYTLRSYIYHKEAVM